MKRTIAQNLHHRGFALAPSAIKPSVIMQLNEEADRLISRFEAGYRSVDYWTWERDRLGDEVLYRIQNLERQGSKPIEQLFVNGPLHGLAASIMGNRVRSTVCAMTIKRPLIAADVPWHRDRTAVSPHTLLNLSVFLDDSDVSNGCLRFVPGSHLLADNASVDDVVRGGPVETAAAQAGDILLHDVRIVHGSGPNRSPRQRRSIIIEFGREPEEVRAGGV